VPSVVRARANSRAAGLTRLFALTTVGAALFCGNASARVYHSPVLTGIAGGNATACWTDYFPVPFAQAYYQSASDGRTPAIEGGPDGINLRERDCAILHKVRRGWRPGAGYRGILQRQAIATAVFVFGHELGHATARARGVDFRDEALADAYGLSRSVFCGILARLGVGAYWRRAIFSEVA
jgi:hypothetical protein